MATTKKSFDQLRKQTQKLNEEYCKQVKIQKVNLVKKANKLYKELYDISKELEEISGEKLMVCGYTIPFYNADIKAERK